MKRIALCSKGLWNSPLLDSRIKTRSVSKAEKIFGHLIGPLGLILIVNTVASLVEKFFLQQVAIMYPAGTENSMGDVYQVVMMVARILGVVWGLANGWLIAHTQSRQGRFRPWILIYGFILVIVCGGIFLFCNAGWGETAYWFYFFFFVICYQVVSTTFFYTYRDNMVSVATRDAKDKAALTFIRMMCWTLISGILIGLLVNTVAIPFWLGNDINGYPILMIILAIVAIPLILLEYYFTRERVVEDVKEEGDKADQPKVVDQIKALFSNKFWVLFMIGYFINQLASNFKGNNVQYYYVQYLLGGDEQPIMQTLYSIITGVPMGIGAFAVYPISKKIGVKNTMLIGAGLTLVGSVLGWCFAENLYVALTAGLIRQFGSLPLSYVASTLLFYAYDSIEYKSGVRVEGLMGISIVNSALNIIYAPFAGMYESSLLRMGFRDEAGFVPDEKLKSFMALCFYGFDIIYAFTLLITMPFITVEKEMPMITKELLRRKKEAVLSSGGTWLEPEEQDRLEKEEADRLHEENRLADLKERCAKKGLDFETENEKYLAKKAEIAAKAKAKQEAKLAKKASKGHHENRSE